MSESETKHFIHGMSNETDEICAECHKIVEPMAGELVSVPRTGGRGVWIHHSLEGCEDSRRPSGRPGIWISPPEEENAGQMLTRLADELASMAKGFNLDGYYDAANEAQKFLMLVVYFREQLAEHGLDEFTWTALMAWKPPKEKNDEENKRDRRS